MTTTTVPETLRAAADRIERVGLHKGSFFKRFTTSRVPVSERPCCTLGAIGYETGLFIERPDNPSSYDMVELYPDGPFSSDGADVAGPDPAAKAIIDHEQAVEAYLRDYLNAHTAHQVIPGWNDDYATTQEGVVSTLRAAADAYVVEGV